MTIDKLIRPGTGTIFCVCEEVFDTCPCGSALYWHDDISADTNHAVMDSLDKSIRDNADVWTELAKR